MNRRTKPDALAVTSQPGALAVPPQARPRKKGPTRRNVVARVVDEQSGVGVDVVFDAQSCQFIVHIPGYPQDIIGTEAGPVMTRARDILRDMRQYQWKQSIVVDAGRSGVFWDSEDAPPKLHRCKRSIAGCQFEVYTAQAQLRFYRIEIAPKPGDPSRFVCRPHTNDLKNKDSDRTNEGNVGDFLERDRAAVIPYTPETWAAVQQLAADVLSVGERLYALTKQPNALAEAGSRLLGSGTDPLMLTDAEDDDS